MAKPPRSPSLSGAPEEAEALAELMAAELQTNLSNAEARYQKERIKLPAPSKVRGAAGSLHLFLGQSPPVPAPLPSQRNPKINTRPVPVPDARRVASEDDWARTDHPYRAFREEDDWSHVRVDRRHRVVRAMELPRTPEINVDQPDDFRLPEGFNLQDFLAEDPEDYEGWLKYHKGLGPKPVPKHVLSAEAKVILAAGDAIDLGELMDEAAPRFPVTARLEDFRDDGSESEEEAAVVATEPRSNLRGLKQRLKVLKSLTSFAANDPGPGVTSYGLEEDARRFVGPGARKRFFARLKLCHAQRELVPASVMHFHDDDEVEEDDASWTEPVPGAVDEYLLTEEAMTPRQRFLREALRRHAADGVLPMPVLLRRRADAPNTLDLTGAGVGDVVLETLAQVMDSLTALDTLLLADNRLTDTSLTPLLEAITLLPNLTSLDLSGAKMDESSATLRAYLASDACALKTLVLARSDVDDFECADFMAALRCNASLETLSLQNNLIGDAEALNTVNPDTDTGGEALAAVLRENKRLTTLDLSWNKIRGDSARELAEALASNETLTCLNVAHNAFSDVPAQYLGVALSANTALKVLDLSFNGVSSTAAIVLAAAFATNATLHFLNVAGNPLGRRGAEALITAIRRHQTSERFLRINFANADLDTDVGATGGGVQFSAADPTGRYRLDLGTPYSQMIARELYHRASTRLGCRFLKCVWSFRPPEPEVDENGEVIEKKEEEEDDPRAKGRIEIAFKRKRAKKDSKKKAVASDDGDLATPWYEAAEALFAAVRSRKANLGGYIVEALKSMGCAPTQACIDSVRKHWDKSLARDVDGVLAALFFALFDGIDEDGSENIDVRELQRGLEQLGCVDASLEAASRIVDAFDADASGTIEREEFVQWALARFLAKAPTTLPELVDAETNKPWKIPQEGGLEILFVSDPQPPSHDMCCSDLGNEGFVRNLKLCDPMTRCRLFLRAVENTDVYFTCAQAQILIEDGGLEEDVLEKLLLVMASTDDAFTLLEKNLALDQRVRLREKMGPVFDAVTGAVSGFYLLNLQEASDRLCARKLCELNNAQRLAAKTSSRADTSQKGNWQNFRNEFYENKPLALSSSFFAEPPGGPIRGRLKFDFVSTRRPKKSHKALSTKRFLHLCGQLQLGELMRVARFYEAMNPVRRARASFYHGRLDNVWPGIGSRARDTQEEAEPVSTGETAADEAAYLKERREDDMREAGDRRAAYALASAAHSAEPNFQDDSTSDDESGDDRGRQSTVVLGCALPWWVRRRDVVRKWRDAKHSTYLTTQWLPVEKPPKASKKKGGKKKKKNEKKQAPAEVVARETADEAHSDSEGEPGMHQFAVFAPATPPYAAKSLPCRAYAIVHHQLATLRVATTPLWLSTEQVEFIVQQFPADDFGRVAAAVILHARCVDLENYHRLLRGLEPREQLELVHRLGWLNCMNPLHPERIYALDLRSPEQREMCKVLVKLASEEPGTTWVGAAYKGSALDSFGPGWERPAAWSSEDHELKGEGGPPKAGRLQLRYSSDPARGCAPKWALRRELRARFLCGEALEF